MRRSIPMIKETNLSIFWRQRHLTVQRQGNNCPYYNNYSQNPGWRITYEPATKESAGGLGGGCGKVWPGMCEGHF